MDSWIGPTAALGAAVCWAVSTALFERVGNVLPAWLLNLTKGSIASLLLGLTILVLWQAPPADARAWIWLTVSGVIGLGLGDTAYFISLRQLGHRNSLLMMLLAPIFAGLIALVVMNEVLSVASWAGIGLTLAGLGWVIAEGDSHAADAPADALAAGMPLEVPSPADAPADEKPPVTAPGEETSANANATPIGTTRASAIPWLGVIFGLVAAVAQAVGAVISRDVMQAPDVTALWASLIRLMAGAAVLLPILAWQTGNRGVRLRQSISQSARAVDSRSGRAPDAARAAPWKALAVYTLVATLIGTYFAIWLQQTAFKHSDTAIAQTLLSTCPLFALPIAAWRGQRVSARAILGAVVAVGGVTVFLAGDQFLGWLAGAR